MSDLADRLEELTKDISREWGNPDKAKLLRERLMHEVWGGREAITAARKAVQALEGGK